MADSVRPWIKLHTGLLHDQDFLAMPARLRGVWTTAYLAVALDGDSCKNRARLQFLLGLFGVTNPAAAVKDLDRAKWLEDVGDGAVTIRGFNKHQAVYRGPSDLPEAKAERKRRSGGERGREGASGGERGEESRVDESRTRPPALEAGRGADPTPEEARAIFQKLMAKGLVDRVPPILGRPEPVVE